MSFILVLCFGSASFASIMIDVFAWPEEGGTVTGGGEYEVGDTVTVEAIPNPGWEFVEWFDVYEGVVASEEMTYEFTVSDHRELEAVFEKLEPVYIVTVSAYPVEGGTVTGGGEYEVGDTVTVEAIPNPGWEFFYWYDVNREEIVDEDNSTYSFTAESDRSLKAFFHEEMPPDEDRVITVFANPDEGGTVTGGGEYEYGATVTIEAEPGDGWEFLFWKESYYTSPAPPPVYIYEMSYSFTANVDRILAAHFEKIQPSEKCYISVTAYPESGGNVAGGDEYITGDSVTVTATPKQGWEFLYWTEHGQVVSESKSYSFIAESDRILVAIFVKIGPPATEYLISVLAEPRNAGIVSGGGMYDAGEGVTVTAGALSGWEFLHWTEHGQVVSESEEHTFIAESDRSLVASFEKKDPGLYTVMVSASPWEGGTVSGGGMYYSGDSVTVTAVPGNGWYFINWTEHGQVVSESEDYTFTADSDRSLVANFKESAPEQYTVTVFASPQEGGAVVGGGVYDAGESVTVTAEAVSGWEFLHWTEHDQVVSGSEDYTFTADSDRSLMANFKESAPEQYTVTVSANPEEGGTVSGGGIYDVGANITVMAEAVSGWEFVYWTDQGLVVSTSPAYGFAVHKEHDLTANFIQKPSAQGLVAWYKFDGTYNDYSGNNFHGTNSCTSWTTNMHGQENQALLFNGWDSGVVLKNGFPDIFGGSFTVSMWVYFYDHRGNILLGSSFQSEYVSFERLMDRRLRINWNNEETDIRTPRLTINTFQWHHITFVRDKAQNKFIFYLDGNEVYNTADIGRNINPQGTFYFGRDIRKGRTVTYGKMDDLRVYNKALSAEEIGSIIEQAHEPTDLEKANNLFNWLESIFPDIVSPGPETQISDGMIFRHYPEDIYLFTYVDHLFFIDQGSNIFDLGLVDFWLQHIE